MKNAREQNRRAIEGWLVTEVRIIAPDEGRGIDRDDVSVWTEIYRSSGEQMDALRNAIGEAYDDYYEGADIDQNDRYATVYAVMNERDPASNTYSLTMGAFTYIWKLDTRMIQAD